MEEEKKTKKQTILIIITSVLFMSLVIGASFAYFASTQSGAGTVPVTVTTKTVDTVTIASGNNENYTGSPNISITATPDNFGSSNDDLKGTAYAKITLQTSNAANHTATRPYTLKLKITNNNFNYSLNSSQPDLLLRVTKGSTELTTISGLNYKTVTNNKNHSVSGFDITDKSGTITLKSETISLSTGSGGMKSQTDKWKVEVILVNYGRNQNNITGKSFAANIELA